VTNVDTHAMSLKKTVNEKLIEHAIINLPFSVFSNGYTLSYSARKSIATNVTLVIAKVDMEEKDTSYISSPKSFAIGKVL